MLQNVQFPLNRREENRLAETEKVKNAIMSEGNPKEELKGLLKYMEISCDGNATNESLKKIHQMMKRVKSDEEVSLEYMKIYEREQMLTERGSQQEAEKNARNLFANGADFELVKNSITTLTEEEL